MAKEVVLVFPGQGSQYVGMGQGLPETAFIPLNQKLGFDLYQLMLNGPEEDLKLTSNAQPAIVAHSVLQFQKLKKILDEKQVTISKVLGHSVGEYSALVAAEVLTLLDAVRAVQMRGRFMQETVPPGAGTMYAIIKVAEKLVAQACSEASNLNELVAPANFNDPEQIVISGHRTACERAVAWLQKNVESRFRAIELKVSAPFHSPLMAPAAKRLQSIFLELVFNTNTIPYIANVNAQEYPARTSTLTIQDNLLQQVAAPVLWSQSIAQLAPDTLCIEVGPGKVLSGLIQKINPRIETIAIDHTDALSTLEEKL